MIADIAGAQARADAARRTAAAAEAENQAWLREAAAKSKARIAELDAQRREAVAAARARCEGAGGAAAHGESVTERQVQEIERRYMEEKQAVVQEAAAVAAEAEGKVAWARDVCQQTQGALQALLSADSAS